MWNTGRWVLAGTLALGCLGGSALARGGGEAGHAHKKLTVDQLPSAVQATFKKEASGGQIEELRSEERGGKTVYEGEVVSKGKGTDLEVSEDGTVLKRSAMHDEASEREHGGR